ncbi:MAG: FAD-dependent oxidoreductase, partial [Cyclobacteriaceae bacterium]|nr:FAD-dependent oxidoreductase [Cyclobacteriaceae bacterium]
TMNGVQTVRAVSHQFDFDVSAYVVPGDSTSGLLPNIHGESPGIDGEADNRLQAYNYRMCLTKVPENKIPFPKPDNYDPLDYELLGRYFDLGWRKMFNKFDPAPNNKTDTNNHGAFSTDYIGMNYDYPEASYERRKEILKEHEEYQKGLMWFSAYDPRVPEDVRAQMSEWGLAKDEFVDNGNWPHQIYVRESRRMVSDFVMTELHLTRKTPTPKSIGMGSYNMDSHNVQRYVDENGFARNEGDIQVSPGGPYQISYEAIIPKKNEATNLLVPVCLSSSHIAYGSIRMEPVFMILGQSAATAAALALEDGIPVQDIDYEKLKERLLADKQVLDL